MKVGIIDVGSNSLRLLIADVENGRVEQLHRERVYARLGDDAYRRGRIGPRKLKETRAVAGRYARIARGEAVERLETVVTAPGRQARNQDELVRVLARATRAPVVVLEADDEGRLAWEGARSRLEHAPDRLAVVDLGGGSCEIAVGTAEPTWVRSMEAGALRITRTFLDNDPPETKQIARARHAIIRLVEHLDPPRSDTVLAVGGTARAAGRILGRRFGVEELETLIASLVLRSAQSVTESHGVSRERARTLLGGALVLSEIACRFRSDLEVGRGGLREGAALALARAEAAAA